MRMSFLGAVKLEGHRNNDDSRGKRKGRGNDFSHDDRGRKFNEKNNRSFNEKPRRERRS
ncbi:Uncharacterised protein [Rodentibacter pneumotropicus]|nr:Uncharacterised protein [Rodentibacter pneumotropicus]